MFGRQAMMFHRLTKQSPAVIRVKTQLWICWFTSAVTHSISCVRFNSDVLHFPSHNWMMVEVYPKESLNKDTIFQKISSGGQPSSASSTETYIAEKWPHKPSLHRRTDPGLLETWFGSLIGLDPCNQSMRGVITSAETTRLSSILLESAEVKILARSILHYSDKKTVFPWSVHPTYGHGSL